jgi:hypothetical protein
LKKVVLVLIVLGFCIVGLLLAANNEKDNKNELEKAYIRRTFKSYTPISHTPTPTITPTITPDVTLPTIITPEITG